MCQVSSFYFLIAFLTEMLINCLRDAAIDAAGETAGMGVALAIGLIASNAVRASTLLASTLMVVLFTVGVVVTAETKVAWDCSFRRRFKSQVNSI